MKDINKLEERIKFKIAISKIDDEKDNTSTNKKQNLINRKLGFVACVCLILTTGVVFAKDIDNYFRKLFNNSNKAIDIAVENGYVQKEEMDYTYDKDIGIKVSSLFLDDTSLDIAFDFEVQDENVKSISIKDIIITNDNNKVVYSSEIDYKEVIDELPIYNYFNGMNEAVKLTDTTFSTSILLGLREHQEFDKLFFQITKIDLIYENNTKETIIGFWNFEITISDEMKGNPSIQYVLDESNEYVENCIGTLVPSGMTIELTLAFPVDIQKIQEFWNEVTVNNIDELHIEINGNQYSRSGWDLVSPLSSQNCSIILHYDNIGIFSENIDTIELVSEVYNTSIVLKKLEI